MPKQQFIDGEAYMAPLTCFEEYQAFLDEARSTNGDIIRSEVFDNTKKFTMPSEISHEFAGLYVHGGHQQFSVREHEPAFASFRKFSKKLYPLYFFYAEDHDHDDAHAKELVKKYAPVEMIEIPVMKNLYDYSKFMLFEAFQKIEEKHEKILCFQHDGFLKIPGWEDFINNCDPDYLGAPWAGALQFDQLGFKDKNKYVLKDEKEIYVGNGGFSFRKRSKMLEVSKMIKEEDIDWDGEHTVEDSYYCYLGFGNGIFKDIPTELAAEFSREPFNREQGFGFHGFL
jgi:hypothetical protein